MPTVQYIEGLLQDSAHQRIADALKDIETAREWLDSINAFVDGIQKLLGFVPSELPTPVEVIVERVPILRAIYQAWKMTTKEMKVILSLTSWLLKLIDWLDPLSGELITIRDKLTEICTTLESDS